MLTDPQIEALFTEGGRAFQNAYSENRGFEGIVESCPHPEDSREHHWWTRGWAYAARLIRAIEAEMILKEIK